MGKDFKPSVDEPTEPPRSASYEAAEKEYYFLQSEIGRFDQISHGIKSWSTTVGFALFAAAFSQAEPAIFLVASAAALLFWITEARWKRYQKFHLERVRLVERFLEFGGGYSGPSVNRSFVAKLMAARGWSGVREETAVMRLANVSLPHDIIVVAGILLFVLARLNIV